MELEDVSQEVQWEARRVAVAFGMVPDEEPVIHERGIIFGGRLPIHHGELNYGFLRPSGDMYFLEVVGTNGQNYLMERQNNDHWWFSGLYDDQIAHFISRAFYRLGFEDESILSQLPELSTHEKLELRLSLPREFWPKTWLDEEAQ